MQLRGYSVDVSQFQYDMSKRNAHLLKLAQRCFSDVKRSSHLNYMLVPFSRDVKRLNLNHHVTKHLSKLKGNPRGQVLADTKFVVAYTAGVSTFRKIYMLKTPLGCGRAGFVCDHTQKKSLSV